MEHRVILNYDNVPGLSRRWPDAVIRPRRNNADLMADTVYMVRRPELSSTDMCRLGMNAAPLAKSVIIENYMPEPRPLVRSMLC